MSIFDDGQKRLLSYPCDLGMVHTVGLEDSQDFVTCAQGRVSFKIFIDISSRRFLTSDDLDLSDTMAVSEDNTDLRRSSTFPGESADVLDNCLWGALEPGGH
jgi:hypothetical protein